MRSRHTYVLVVLGAALALLVVAAAAHANRRITVATGGEALNTMTAGAFEFEGGLGAITCEMTLRFSLHRTISKVGGSLAGLVSEARVAESRCRGGRIRVLAPEARAPWHIRYISFAGTLPTEVSSITLELGGTRGVSFLAEQLGLGCLYEGAIRGIAEGARDSFERVTADSRTTVRLLRALAGSEGFCPATGSVRGSFRLATTVRIRLGRALARSEPRELRWEGEERAGKPLTVISDEPGPVTVREFNWEPPGSETGYVIEMDRCTGTTLRARGEECRLNIAPNERAVRARLLFLAEDGEVIADIRLR